MSGFKTIGVCVFYILFISLFSSCENNKISLYDKFDFVFNRFIVKDKKIKNSVLFINSIKNNLYWIKPYGISNPEKNIMMTEDTPFHAASIGKMFTSVIIAMLYEEGKINFEDYIADYLPDELITGLNVYKGKDYKDKIKILNLLNHTSGIPDYYDEKYKGGTKFIDLMLKDKDRFWTPQDTINFAKENVKAYFPPGEGFHYADTNYQLLGLIVEKIENKPLHEVLKDRIWIPLGMNHTWFYQTSNPIDPDTKDMAATYFKDMPVTNHKSISASWGGGGCVSTVEDLSIFIRAVTSGRLIKMKTLKKMQKWVKGFASGIDYGYGIMRLKPGGFSLFLKNYPEMWGHLGSTGTFLFYNEEYDLVVCGTLNQTSRVIKPVFLIIELLGVIRKK